MKKNLFLFSMMAIGLVMGCKEENPLTVEPDSIVLYPEGTEQITTNAAGGVTYVSDDVFYAEVDDAGLVTAKKVGETSVKVAAPNGMATIPVTVLPAYSLYPDLDKFVGKSDSDVIKALGEGYTLSSSSSPGKTNMFYESYTSYVTALLFVIDNGGVESCAALLPTSEMTRITKALLERYSPYAMQNDIYYFVNHDGDVIIALTVVNARQIMVAYTSRGASKSSDVIELPEELYKAFE